MGHARLLSRTSTLSTINVQMWFISISSQPNSTRKHFKIVQRMRGQQVIYVSKSRKNCSIMEPKSEQKKS